MTLSVIVPAHDVAAWIGACLCSVLDEADGDVELVCVDDGSTDGTGAAIDAVARGAARFVALRRPNGGAGAARNAGLAAASGDWVLFLDGDDCLAKGWRAAVRTLAARHPSAGVLGFGLTRAVPPPPVGDFASREIDVSRTLPASVCRRGLVQFAYRRNLLDGLSFAPFVLGEDKLFQGLALLRALRAALADAPVYGYRLRPGSAVQSPPSRRAVGDDLAWRLRWLEALAASGKTLDARAWRDMGLDLLEYVPHRLRRVADPAGRAALERCWFETLAAAAAHPFAPHQRAAMRLLGATRSRTAAACLSSLPYAVKHLVRFGSLS